MTATLRIDFVSDISCPWCAIGLASLEQALAETAPEITAELHFQPFELNPGMPPEGQDITEHLTQKYGTTPAQQAQAREAIRQRGADVGFVFRREGRDRIYNTFDAHRLLHWAGLPSTQPGGLQHALKKRLFGAYFTDGESPASHAILLGAVADVGLDVSRAREILDGNDYADELRRIEGLYTDAGIHSVPAIILNSRHLISGAQPVSLFVQALREIAGESPEQTAP
ncbi:DsbA family oxidoreductase [Propionivibrio dicarboxylicus]|uniref:Predicted dithiol-disulfide isomerase, DsbA family n=1 Tax=Propionivibrio dicarboxylicus TaxID=83767 RepID=A0A1G7WLF0_9RHOO|nr:DsbA family oxidoreductase [Propionivibrio dicarboxylicus]SDG72714.1 Predicted dithiol-disulfide isomerase, DsbA family [Propionivibrio dicarboxylicus]